MPEKRRWSRITSEQMLAYLIDAGRLVEFVKQNRISLFGAALGGAALIREALNHQGGDPKWWQRLILVETEKLAEFFIRDPPN